ncbi:MAG: FecR domain-containing protein, partial [Polyangiales bacterium]
MTEPSEPPVRWTELLAREELSVAPPDAATRDAAIGAMIHAAYRERERRVLRTRTLGAVALIVTAAAAGVVAGISRRAPSRVASLSTTTLAQGHVERLHAGLREPISGGATIAEGDELVTAGPSDVATVALPSKTQVKVEGASALRVVNTGATQQLALDTGAATFEVTKLHAGERFVVRTPDVEVEVRGTIFRLVLVAPDADCADGSRTRLSVVEGVVSVRFADRAEVRVGAGERWPDCVDARASRASPSAATSATAPAPAAVSSSATRASTSTSTSSTAIASAPSTSHATSDLGEQNDLLARAMLAKRQG